MNWQKRILLCLVIENFGFSFFFNLKPCVQVLCYPNLKKMGSLFSFAWREFICRPSVPNVFIYFLYKGFVIFMSHIIIPLFFILQPSTLVCWFCKQAWICIENIVSNLASFLTRIFCFLTRGNTSKCSSYNMCYRALPHITWCTIQHQSLHWNKSIGYLRISFGTLTRNQEGGRPHLWHSTNLLNQETRADWASSTARRMHKHSWVSGYLRLSSNQQQNGLFFLRTLIRIYLGEKESHQ